MNGWTGKTFSRGDRVVLITCYDSSLILENISMAEVRTFNDGVCVLYMVELNGRDALLLDGPKYKRIS